MKLDEIVEKYIKLRDKKARMKADYDASVADIDNMLDKIEGVILSNFKELGAQSLKTPFGTAYTSVRTTASVADWDAYFTNFILPNQAWEFLEHRASKSAVEQYKNAHGEIPPGINYSETITLNVRRS